jgi:PAS domain S-box-containing protein
VIFVTYYLTAKIGFEFALQPGSVSTLWMPNSILLAGLLLTARRWWWLVILAAFPSHLASELQSGVPTPMVLSWFVSNSLQAFIAAFCITYFVKDQVRFDRLRDLSAFLVFGAFLAPFASSFLDSALVKLNGWGTSTYWDLWRIRFLSNVLASLTVIPFVLGWVNGGITAVRNARLSRYVEGGLLTFGLLAVGLVIFNSQPDAVERLPALLYWPLPLLLWATVRFGPRGISSALLAVMFLAIAGSARGTGPFVTNSSTYTALSIQGFLIVVSIPLMVLAAVMEERQRAEALARDNEQRLTLALNAAQMDTWDWQIQGDKLIWSAPTKVVFGFNGDDSDRTPESFFSVVHPEDIKSVQSAITRAINEGTPYEVEFRIVRNGEVRWFLSKGNVFYDHTGKPLRMLGIGIDITGRKQAEAALSEINERNRAILRALPDMMFLQDKEGVFLDYYARDVEHLLVPPEAFLGKSVREVLPAPLAERILEVLSRLDDSDQPQILEYTLRIGDEDRHYEARLVKAEGHHALSIVRDVTESRRAAEAVRQSEAKLLQSTRQIRALAARLITAQESERRRISLLLHDDVSQSVAALGLGISRLKRKLPASSEQTLVELDKLGVQAHDLTTQIRKLSHQLHPDVLEHLGLVAALQSHVKEFGADWQIETSFAADVRSNPIPLDVSVCLYRVALEALTNVSKHSGAKSADVALKETDGFLRLEVSDSGKGFDVEKARRGSGLGLASSEERIRHLRGTLEIQSDSQNGTLFIARVPLSGGL